MEKRKETITREHFIAEKKKFFKKNILLISLLIFPLFTILIFGLSILFHYYLIVFFILETIFTLILLLYCCVPLIKDWKNINNENFILVQDTLRSSTEGTIGSQHRPGKPYSLYFSTYGKYEIPPLNYTWSKEFKATDKDIYNRACIGDTFYLFIAEKSILEVYNTKVFEYKE